MSDESRKIILDRNKSSLLLNAASGGFDTRSALHGVEDALLSLLLFDEAEITVENSDERAAGIERLKNEGIAAPIPKVCFHEPSKLLDSYFGNTSADPETEARFTALAQENSFRAIWELMAANDDELISSQYENNMFDLRMWANELGGGSSVYDANFGDYAESFAEQCRFGLPGRLEYQAHPQWMGELEQHLARMSFEDDVAGFANELRRTNETVPVFLSRYVEMRGILERAASTGYPICTNFEDGNFELDVSLGADAFQLCRIHLEEVRSVPYIQNLDDILRLRGHPYLTNFRHSLFEWLDRISAGETNVEQKYRDQIRLANKEIEKLDNWRHLDSPYTLAASLAVGVAEVFSGTFFGFGFGIASGAAMLHKRKVKNNYGYALFRP